MSAVIQNGASHRIVQDWLAGVALFDVVMCPELLAEIRGVLTNRRRLRKWVELDVAVAFVDTIEALVDLVEDPEFVESEIRDPDDNYLARSIRLDVFNAPILAQRTGERRIGTAARRTDRLISGGRGSRHVVLHWRNITAQGVGRLGADRLAGRLSVHHVALAQHGAPRSWGDAPIARRARRRREQIGASRVVDGRRLDLVDNC